MNSNKTMESQPQAVSDEMFILSPDEAYAGMSRADWEAIIQYLKFFKSVDVDGMEPNDQDCDICHEPFCGPDPYSCSEDPVCLPCDHVFGRNCIGDWIAAANGREYYEEQQPQPTNGVEEVRTETTFHDLVHDQLFSKVVETFTCPKCRRKFTLAASEDQAPAIAARLRFWDLAYEKIGITRSDDEEACRQDLRLFVSKSKVQPLDATTTCSLERRARVAAMRFSLGRARRILPFTQWRLIESFFHLGCYGANDDPKAHTLREYANRPIPLWCWQFDRLERGLNPWYAPAPTRAESMAKLIHEWKQQRLVPWTWQLFEDMEKGRLVNFRPEFLEALLEDGTVWED